MHTLDHFPFSVIGVTETWLHTLSPEVFNLQNYEMIRHDRVGKRGGVIAFYIQENLKFKIRHDLSITECESLFIEIESLKEKNIIIGLIYRPPNSHIEPFFEDFERCFNALSRENKRLYNFIMGDFNIDLLSQNNNHETLLQLAYSNAFYPHINKPTRIDINSSTLIDNIFSNIYDVDITSGILYSDISDHLPIFVICHTDFMNEDQAKQITFRKETPQNIESFKNDLASEEWFDVYSQRNAENAYELFNKKLQLYYDNNFPLITTEKKNKHGKLPWITKAILKSIHTRNRLYKIYLKDPTTRNSNRYKKIPK